jgi:hypothetical protein
MRFSIRDATWFMTLVAVICAWYAETTKHQRLVDALRAEREDLAHRLYVVKDRRDFFWDAGRWHGVPRGASKPVLEEYDPRDRMK